MCKHANDDFALRDQPPGSCRRWRCAERHLPAAVASLVGVRVTEIGDVIRCYELPNTSRDQDNDALHHHSTPKSYRHFFHRVDCSSPYDTCRRWVEIVPTPASG